MELATKYGASFLAFKLACLVEHNREPSGSLLGTSALLVYVYFDLEDGKGVSYFSSPDPYWSLDFKTFNNSKEILENSCSNAILRVGKKLPNPYFRVEVLLTRKSDLSKIILWALRDPNLYKLD